MRIWIRIAMMNYLLELTIVIIKLPNLSRASYSSNETDGNANAGRVTNFNYNYIYIQLRSSDGNQNARSKARQLCSACTCIFTYSGDNCVCSRLVASPLSMCNVGLDSPTALESCSHLDSGFEDTLARLVIVIDLNLPCPL